MGFLAALLACAAGADPGTPAIADEQASGTGGGPLPAITVTGAAIRDAYVVPDASTGTKTDTPLMETPLSIQVVPAQVLQDQQVISIDQALKNVSGVTVGSGANNSFGNAFDGVTIRGFTTDSHLRNGVRIDSFGGDTELFTQQLANVERIEVLKGPAAILYGAVEPGGVVNVVTKQPQATPSYAVEQQAGSYDLYRASLGATGPVGPENALLYRLDASYLTSGSILDLGFRRDLFVAPVFRLDIDASTQLRLEYEHKDANFNGNYGSFPLIQAASGSFVPLFNDPSLNFGEQSSERELADLIGVNWSHRFDDRWSIRQQILVNVVHYRGPQIEVNGIGPVDSGNPSGPPATYRDATPDDTYNRTYATYLDLTGHFATGPLKHTLLVGADAYKFVTATRLGATNLTYAPNASVDSIISLFAPAHPGTPLGPIQPYLRSGGPTDSVGLYLQDQVALPYDVFVLAGLRFQHVNQDNLSGFATNPPAGEPTHDGATTPRVGVLWHPQPWFSLYGNYARNWGPSNGYPISPTKLVPPTGAHQVEVGSKFDGLGGRLAATIALYDLTKTDIPTPNPAQPNFYLVTGAVRSKGLEFDLQGELRPGWSVIVNYANDNARVTSSNDPNNPIGTQWYDTPRNTANLWSTYDTAPGEPRGLRVGAGATFHGMQPPLNYTGAPGRQAGDYAEIGAYTTFGLMGAYRFRLHRCKVNAQLNVSNLLDKKYISYIFLNNPGPGTSYAYNGQNYGFDWRLYGDPRIVTGALSVEF